MSKICIVCGDPKDPNKFYSNPTAKNGESAICTSCAKDYVRKYNEDKKVPGKPNYHKTYISLNDKFICNCF